MPEASHVELLSGALCIHCFLFACRKSLCHGLTLCGMGSLQELEVGQKQHVWVQSQTTFACVAKNEEGQHMCKVLKQKIWVEGVSYELQEIYGMEHASDGRVRTQVGYVHALMGAQDGFVACMRVVILEPVFDCVLKCMS